MGATIKYKYLLSKYLEVSKYYCYYIMLLLNTAIKLLC